MSQENEKSEGFDKTKSEPELLGLAGAWSTQRALDYRAWAADFPRTPFSTSVAPGASAVLDDPDVAEDNK